MPHDTPSSKAHPAPGDGDFRDLAETAAFGLHFVDGNGIIIWANAADYEYLGYSAEEYIGHHISEFHDQAGAVDPILAQLTAGQPLIAHPARLRTRDGSIRHVEITSSGRFEERDGERRFLHSRCLTLDVTERRLVEQARNLLLQAGIQLSRSLDVEKTLATLSSLVVPQFADWYAVHLLNADGVVAPVRISHVDPAKIEAAWAALADRADSIDGNSAAAVTIRTGRPALIPRVDPELLAQAARDEEHLRMLQEAGIRSAMVVPLKQQDLTIGAMTFVAAESERTYGSDDLAVAETLASRAGLAIANARLHHQATEARAAAERSAQRLQILLRVSESVARSLNLDEALAQLAEHATPTLADYCVTYRLDSDGSIARVGMIHADSASQHLVEALARAGPPTLHDPTGAGAVLRTGEPIFATHITRELTESAAQNAEHATVLRELRPISTIVVPLRARGRVLGGASFVTTELSGRQYTKEDLALAEELAARAALLVDNARLYEEGRAANQAMEDMLSVVAHDLRNPLNTIVTSGSLLGLNLPEEERRRTVGTIQRATERMGRLLDDLLDITRIGQHRLAVEPAPTDLVELVREAVANHEPIAQTRGIGLSHDTAASRLMVEADSARVIQALSNLIDNALKFTPAGGEVRVEVGPAEADGEACISVCDTGRGILPEQLPRLFDRFWRSEGDGRNGLGLGLSIAKGIMDAHGGRIVVQSVPGEGSRFAMILPDSSSGARADKRA